MVANIMQKICIKKESYLRRNNFIYILIIEFYVFITIKERLLMKRTLLFSLLLTLALPLNAQTLEGKWKLNPVAGSLGVGPNPGDYSWWSIDASTVTTRACLYDDEYIFNSDSTFKNVMGDQTWLEPWQEGIDAEACGAPIAPHNGSSLGTWSVDETAGTITITGSGNFLGLSKVHNAGEDGKPANNKTTYNYKMSRDGKLLDITIQGFNAGVSTAEWFFQLKRVDAPAIQGSWSLKKAAGSLGVGPSKGDISWWSNSADDVTTRACLFDDEYVFNADGSFKNIMGSQTWLETWQTGVSAEGCGTPVTPHNGSNTATWTVDETNKTVTVKGDGAFLGLAKVHNTGEDGNPANDEITYVYEMSTDGTEMTVTINYSSSGTNTWQYVFTKNSKTVALGPFDNTVWTLAPVAGALGVGPAPGDYSWWSSSESDVTTRACLFDDEYKFNAGGVFQNVMGDQTWLEGWQEGQDGESCGTPIAPHNGSNSATWSYDATAKTITVVGSGAFLGLAKVHNTGEDGKPANNTITYKYDLSEDGGSMDLTINYSTSGTNTWRFKMVQKGFDVVPPKPATDVAALKGVYTNAVAWIDSEGETGETYTVYASRSAITKENLKDAEVVEFGVLEDAQSANHMLYSPLSNRWTDYYYAVTSTDAAQNVSDLVATTVPTSNMAMGIPVISMTKPSGFKVDGDISDWKSSGITPFMMGVSSNSYNPSKGVVSAGTVTDDNDAHMELYIAIDADSLYVGANVTDDVFNAGSGNWWEQDALELFMGLYDRRGKKHAAPGRKKDDLEPDYKFVAMGDSLFVEFGKNTSLEDSSWVQYKNTGVNNSPDAVIEFAISLKHLAGIVGEKVFAPKRGMRIPFEPTWHDNDGTYEGNITMSSKNTDRAYYDPTVWSETFLGKYDGDRLSVEDELVATDFDLKANYPNPFNPTTTIEYSIGVAGPVKLMVYDLLGREMVRLVDDYKSIGTYKAVWNAASMPSGVYFYRIEAGDFVKTQKMILMK